MLQGTNNNNDSFAKLLADSKDFFTQLDQFFAKEVELLMGPARAITKYVTAYVYKVAKENNQRSLARLDKMIAEGDPRLNEKLLRYLERSTEFLTRRAENSRDSALFIPVPFHSQVAEQLNARAQASQALLNRARLLVPPSTKPAKSWFSLFLHYANTLPNVWTAGYGLGRDNLDKDIPTSRLNVLLAELSLLENNPELSTTKTSERMMKIAAYTGEPSADSEFHSHVPPLKPLMTSFKNYMGSQQILSEEGVHEAIKTEYPNPRPGLAN